MLLHTALSLLKTEFNTFTFVKKEPKVCVSDAASSQQ